MTGFTIAREYRRSSAVITGGRSSARPCFEADQTTSRYAISSKDFGRRIGDKREIWHGQTCPAANVPIFGTANYIRAERGTSNGKEARGGQGILDFQFFLEQANDEHESER